MDLTTAIVTVLTTAINAAALIAAARRTAPTGRPPVAGDGHPAATEPTDNVREP